jgi:adenylate kinase
MEDKITYIKTWLGSGSINIFGIQFSGKDTVGKHLAAVLDAEFLSSGDIVRAARETAPDADIRAAAVTSDSGALMPIDEFKDLIVPFLYDEKLRDRALILSSVGRWIGEEVPVMAALRRGGHDTHAVILLNMSEAEVWHRAEVANQLRDRNVGRADESHDGIKRRLAEFRDKTLPVIDKYRAMGILIEINGEQSREAVFADVVDKLYEFSRVSALP